ncbi:MAG: VWA domain-containing protein [Lachnospiraceae bacterium]|nr:VWA domain-containing protein [Lachnospiraceae bacterium]
MKKNIIQIIASCLVLTLLCSCALNPGIITNNNSGEQSKASNETVIAEPEKPVEPVVQLEHSDEIIVDNLRPSNLLVENDEDDTDGDGLSNSDERKYFTSIYNADSDFDWLSDNTEILVYGTNPLNSDTDRDSVSDYLELELGLDPLKIKSDAETLDSERFFEKTYTYNDVDLSVKGSSNSMNVYIEDISLYNFDKTPGVCSPIYELYNYNNGFDSATLSIKYDEDKLVSKDINPENLHIYQLKEDGSFVDVGGTVDTKSKTVSADLEHFSFYFLADSTKVRYKQETDVFLLIDNSGSMYPKEMAADSEENDVDFKRVDMAKALVSMTDDSIKYAVAKFTGSFTPLVTEFTNNEEKLCTSIDTIKTDEEFFNGTYIATSLVESAKYFKEYSDHRKFIIMLTDGKTTENTGLFSWSWYDENDAISLANEYNVSIIVIGLGNSIDTEYLTKIAEGTGGYHVYANDADALDKVYKTLMAAMTYGFVDTDGDGTNDHILLADSGFDVTKDGWKMRNYIIRPTYETEIAGGQCAGLATVAQLWYRYRSLPATAEKVDNYIGNGSWLIPQYVQSDEYDISEVEFFNREKKAALSELTLFDDLDALLNRESQYIYTRDTADDKHIIYNDEIKGIIEKYSNLIEVETYPCKTAKIWDYDNKEYTSVDSLLYNLYEVDYNSLSPEEQEVYNTLQMIYHYYAIQGKDELFNTINIQSVDFERDIREKNFQEVLNKINSGIPMIVSGSGHAVNAIRITRSIENPYEYNLVIYDNNRPNKECNIKIEKYLLDGFDLVSATAIFNRYNYRFIDLDGVFVEAGNEVNLTFREYLG